ncbi:MAG: PP2C family protein-serine/threonine phosphatase [Thermoanaerobaculia bacterium]
MSRRPGTVQRLRGFFQEYTQGLESRDFKRLFDRDAAQAYAVLTREHSQEPEPEKRMRRFFFRARIAFLGLSYKLSPPRRLLFGISVVALFFGLFTGTLVIHRGKTLNIQLDYSPFWFVISIGCLLFLLALELVDRVRVRDELEIARELQRDLLPRDLPIVPGYLFAHSYRTANEVGGDFYGLVRLPDGRLALMVADASGHGMASGLVMAIANATWRTALDLDPSPEPVIAMLNRTLWRTGTTRTFMSVFYGLLDPETGTMEYVCAGHPFPLLRRAGGRTEELGNGGYPLGLRDPLPIASHKVTIEPGDLLLLYTDGLPEALDAQGGTAFGYEKVQAAMQLGGTPQQVHDAIRRSFDLHVGDEVLRDDLTLLVIARGEALARTLTPGPSPGPSHPPSPGEGNRPPQNNPEGVFSLFSLCGRVGGAGRRGPG